MNKLTKIEADFLKAMDLYLKEDINRQFVLNIFRGTQIQAEYRGKTGYQKDVNWSDTQLK